MAARKDFRMFRGNDVVLRIRMQDKDGNPINGSVAGWQTQYTMRRRLADTTAALTASGAIVDAGSPTTPGVFEVVLTRAQLLALDAAVVPPMAFHFAFTRINSGQEITLTEGRVSVPSGVRDAVV